MTEDIDRNPQVWERLFPSPERRRLAEGFVKKVSMLQGIEKVAVMEVGSGLERQQRLFVFSKGSLGIPDPDELDDVQRVFLEVCPDEATQKLLGYTPVITESLFQEDREGFPDIRDKEVTVLWSKPERQTVGTVSSL